MNTTSVEYFQESFLKACRCISLGKHIAGTKYRARAERVYKALPDDRDAMQAIGSTGAWAPPFHVWDIAIEEQQAALFFTETRHAPGTGDMFSQERSA